MITHITDRWENSILRYLRGGCTWQDGLGYTLVHVLTTPVGDFVFDSAMPAVPYWTLAIIMSRHERWYVMFSDHRDGVYKRIAAPNGGKYVGDQDTCSDQTSEYEEHFLDVSDPTYVQVDWWSGNAIFSDGTQGTW